jgi:hypothetical protein
MHVHATNGKNEHAPKKVNRLFPFCGGREGGGKKRDGVQGWIFKIHVPICSQ